MSIEYTIEKIVAITHGRLVGDAGTNWTARFLLTDSRRLVFPASTLFFALSSSQNDGHRYIDELAGKGVKCFVVSQLPNDLQSSAFILVKDTLESLQKIAAYHRSAFSCPVLGITGSNGKTIVKEWLSQLLADKLSMVKNPRSYNSQIGVPLSVWQLDPSHQLGIFEAGISQMGEMERLEKIIQPHTGVFTNIGPAHEQGFADQETKILEKLKLFSRSRLLIYRCDNPTLDSCIRKWASSKNNLKLFRWGNAADAHIRIVSKNKTTTQCHLEFIYESQHYSYVVPFTDEASLENILHCIAFVFCMKLQNGWMAEKLKSLQPVAMRMELKQAVNNCSIINDTYNSDFYSLGIALDFLMTQVQHKEKVLIISDILQTGMQAQSLYANVASLLKEKKVHHMIAIGKELMKHKHCFQGVQASFFADTDEFLLKYDFNNFQNQAILLKGARDFGFERISNKLQLKDHQTLLEINLNALVHNINVYKSLLKPGVKIMAMVKAFSYGSGSYEIANLMQFHQLDYLAVAFADEGNDLRGAGITMPILVLNPELHNLDVLFRYQLEPEVYSLSLLQRIAAESGKFTRYNIHNPFPLHLKLDSGMHRLGFMDHEIDDLIAFLKSVPALKVASVFSHFAASDQREFDSFTFRQIERFESMCGKLEQGLGYGFLKHIANTSAISRFSNIQYDMVRLGIGMYGVDGNMEVEALLQNVTTFKSVISQIKFIPTGETVGYNRAGKLSRDTRLAIVPAGYADGLDRRLGNGNAYLVVNGQKAPIVGNISMDMCALDVTDINAQTGDEVIIFGEEISVKHMAQKLDTIPYEIFTGVSSRVKRVYFQE